jgi:hypothetical protein
MNAGSSSRFLVGASGNQCVYRQHLTLAYFS